MATVAEAGPIVAHNRSRDRAQVRAWLTLVAVMIVAMVVVGGATRLTNAGLSITEWQPIHGVIPPLNDQQWLEEFAKYQQIPEYQQINKGMSLEEFKTIFWWEWSHRLLGRAIGVVVLLPLVFFWVTGRLEAALKPRLVAIFVLGALQGVVGWWMVASGLSERTDVSQYRLATHLTLACVILAYVWWVARSIAPSYTPSVRRTRYGAIILIALAFIQIFLGGLVAGLNAGLTFNTWPMMDGTWVPSGLFLQHPWWINLFENVATVQFQHRVGAYVLMAAAVIYAFVARKTPQASGAWLLAGLVLVQAAIGVATLIAVVPLPLGLLHQFGAVVVLSYAVTHLRSMSRPLPIPA